MKKNLPVTDIENEILDTDFLISQTDLKGKIAYVSPDFCRISEFTSDEMVGKPHNIIRHPDIPPAMYQDMWKTIQSGKPWNGVIKNRAKSGNYYWVEALMMPIIRENKIEGYLSVRKKVNQKEREKAISEYKKKWKQKERFNRFERLIQWLSSYNTKLGFVILAALISLSIPVVGYSSTLLHDRSCLRDFQINDLTSCIPEIENQQYRINLNLVLRVVPAISSSIGTDQFAVEIKKFEQFRNDSAEFDAWVKLAQSNESEAVIRASLDKLNQKSIDIVESIAQGQLAMIQWKTTALLSLLTITFPIAIFGGFWVITRFNRRLVQVMDSVTLLSGGHIQKFSADHRDWSMRKFKTIMVSLDSLTTVLAGVFSKITNAVEDSQKVSISLAQNSELLLQLSQRLASTSKDSRLTVDEFHNRIQAITESVQQHSQKMSVLQTSMNDLSTAMSNVGQEIQKFDTISNSLEQSARDGEVAVQHTVKALDEIKESSKRITEVVTIISDISNRINLLALNAAIESARAGEAGRGFAVVADEISSLADRTAASIKEISSLVKNTEGSIQTEIGQIQNIIDYLKGMLPRINELQSSAKVVTKVISSQFERIETATSLLTNLSQRADEIKNNVESQRLVSAKVVSAAEFVAESSAEIVQVSTELSETDATMKKIPQHLSGIISFLTVDVNSAKQKSKPE